MRTIGLLILCAFTCTVTGCGTMLRKLDSDNTFLVSAEPLDPKTWQCAADADDLGCLASVVSDSRAKCTAFMNGLVLHENTANTAFDSLTTLFSAAATVTTPLRAAHLLTGGATISSGWKNSINANIYNKMSIANYAQALDITYTKDMRAYLNTLGSFQQTNKSVEMQKIEFIHSECSLAMAQGTITTTLQQAANATPK